ncbi:MAG: nicotinate-nucleotide adenylyltransferase [Selenomonas sp.]|uniref:nicotinate-nucleotide adenylyltransferase n=1 Tax=Selenomonas sp. TaxID=2053611 RepID=UPI0025E7A142|nr:nicotinate-nucleotide adenylyltransferase [Selenomonas sp.]MCR5757520.1 nicotinate-nucleotide adenylyltransferase [Selenomonas sp.]
MKKRIGLMGGTFDPIHLAHLHIAEEAREAFQLDKVLFIPAAQPPHKQGRRIASAQQRIKMVEMAIAGNPHFALDLLEMERQGPSYSWLTVQEMQRRQGKDVELYFITGSDSINDLPNWNRPRELVGACQFIGTTRPEVPFAEEMLLDFFGAELCSHIHELPVPLMEISSTLIRERVAQGRSIRYLVPECVADYIKEEGLYK